MRSVQAKLTDEQQAQEALRALEHKAGSHQREPEQADPDGRESCTDDAVKLEGEILRRAGVYDDMAAKGRTLMDTYGEALGAKGIAHQIVGEPWLFDCVFAERAVVDYRGVLGGDSDLARTFNQSMRASGILKADAKLYTHAALTETDMDQIQTAIYTAAKAL